MPPMSPLAALARSGVLEYTRGRAVGLRASPRFVAHAEQTAARLGLHASLGTTAILAAALDSWDEEGLGLRDAAPMLTEFLAERHQLGLLRPVFPVLEHFAAA